MVVTAAGNSASGTSLSLDPAYDPWLISVDAADTMGTAPLRTTRPRPSRQARGCRPPLCAGRPRSHPGAHLQGLRVPGSYVDQNNPNAALGDLYFRGSGTSEAAAYVTGAVALLLQKNPQLTPDQVKDLLTSSTVKLRAPSLIQGGGELDLNQLLDGHGAAVAPGPRRPRRPAWSNGSGSLEASRGNDAPLDNGFVL